MNYNLKKYLTLLGGVLIHFSLGSINTFPIISTYITSYLREIALSDVRYSTSGWIATSNVIVLALQTCLSGFIVSKFRPNLKIYILIGCFLYCLGNGLTYFTIQSSFLLTLLTYGILITIGAGSCYLIPFDLSMKWFPNNKGLVSATILSGFSIGCVIFSQIEAIYINPKNYSPDKPYSAEYPYEKYYSKEKYNDLLQRVPKYFLFSTMIFVGFQIVGSIILFEKNENFNNDNENGSLQTNEVENDSENLIIDNQENSLGVRYKNQNEGMFFNDIIRLPQFYIILSMLINFTHTPSQITTYYKAFGQTWISDDAFFSLISSLAAVFGAFGGLFWGFIMDRFSIKLCYLILSASSICIGSTIYLTKFIGIKELYLVWVCGLYLLQSGFSVMIPTIVTKCFGQKNFTSIFGVLYLSTLPVAFLDTFLNEIINTAGWFWFFFIGSCLSLIGFISAIFFNVRKENGEDI